MKKLIWLAWFLCCGGLACGAEDQFAAGDLPPEARETIAETRKICREVYPEMQLYDGLEGISFVSVEGLGDVVMVDNEHICGNIRTAGVNCTNRGCDLAIWGKGKNGWKKLFEDHLYQKFISVRDGDRLVAIVASIYAGSPQCKPKPGAEFTSGQSCDVVIRYRRGGWQYELLR